MPIKALLLSACLTFMACPQTVKNHNHPDFGLNPKQLIRKHGYPLEVHTIVTEDGYILETHRIPYGKNNANATKRHPVLLFPALMCNSGIFLVQGPGHSLGFVLADNGYDVWIANYRGTTFSRKHKILDPVRNKKEFFDYSFEEIGLYDIAANIDHILNLTYSQKLFYVGFSLGTTSFFTMAAEKPEYNKKVALMVALGPSISLYNVHLFAVTFLSENLDQIGVIIENNNMYELFPYTPLLSLLTQTFCHDRALTQVFCSLVLYVISGYSPNLNKTVFPIITNHAPAGISARTVLHYMQLARTEQFHMYDFGKVDNMKRYGQITPPIINTSKITVPVALYYGGYDALATRTDVELLASVLPNVVRKSYTPDFSHLDFVLAVNITTRVYDDVIRTMKNCSKAMENSE